MMSSLQRPVVHILSNIADLAARFSSLMPELQFVTIPAHTDDRLATAEFEVSDEQAKHLQKADILIADPLLLGGYVQELPNLKWMQSTWAGVDSVINRLDLNKPLPTFPMCRLAGKYGGDLAEFTICHILAKERRLIDIYEDQKKKQWLGRQRGDFRPLPSLSIGILGLGDIGKEVAKKCKAFDMTVWGLVYNVVAKEKRSEYVDHYRSHKDLHEVLESCDYICSILPSTAATRDMLSGDVLSRCKQKKPLFINIGRGDVIDEGSVIRALRNDWISGAVLDVFNTEPLPKESQLWDEPNMFIFPHIASVGSPKMVLEIFKENWEHYTKGDELKYVIDWKKGY